jgi:hypothetical protein
MILFLHGSEHAVTPVGWTLTTIALALAIHGLALGAASLLRLWRSHRRS